MWDSDNAIFNVNGEGLEKLIKAIDLAFNGNKIVGWKFKQEFGICLYYYDSEKINKFPVPATAKQCGEFVFEWLQSDDAKKVPCKGKDADCDHDGHNSKGWRVYTEDWGHIDNDWNVIAIKPCFLWHGK